MQLLRALLLAPAASLLAPALAPARSLLHVRPGFDDDGNLIAEGVDDAPPVVSLSAVETEVEEATREPRWKEQARYQGFTKGLSDSNVGPKSYEGLVDGEEFDGGDGQVGVVGDGNKKLDKMRADMGSVVTASAANTKYAGPSEAVGGKDSKTLKTKVAFGFTSGYADELKEKGMVQINKKLVNPDEYSSSADELYVRRQQLENWQNQQGLRQEQVAKREFLSKMGGTQYDNRRATDAYKEFLETGKERKTASNQKDTLSWEVEGMHHLEAADGAPSWFSATPSTVTSGTVQIKAKIGDKQRKVIDIENDAMTYEDFYVALTPGSSTAFEVSPIAGTLEKHGGATFPLTVTFTGTGGEESATLICQTEESKFTYELRGTSGVLSQ